MHDIQCMLRMCTRVSDVLIWVYIQSTRHLVCVESYMPGQTASSAAYIAHMNQQELKWRIYVNSIYFRFDVIVS